MTIQRQKKPFSMIREFHLADWITLANAACGASAIFAMMSYLQTLDVLHIYLACGLVGALAQIAANPNSLTPTLGASGAIAGIMGAYVVWFPHNRVRVLVFRFIVLLPAFVVIGGWIALQVWQGFGSVGHLGEVGGVAYFAHIGGAATGIFVALLFHDRARYLHTLNARDEWIAGV